MPFTKEWLATKAKMAYRGAVPPDPTKFRVALADSNMLTVGSSKVDFIRAELLEENGYVRQQFLYSSDGAYNEATMRYEMPILDVSFTAVGAPLQFQTAFLIADASSTASRGFTSADVNPATDRIAIASHGLSDNDEVLFVPDTGSVLPSGLTTSLLYKAVDVTENDFKLPIDIIDTGSGTMYCCYARGIIVAFSVEDAPIQILDGATHSFRIPIAEVASA